MPTKTSVTSITTGKARSAFTDRKAVTAAMLSTLKESGLGKAEAEILRLEPMTADDVRTKTVGLPKVRAGYRIPYFMMSGRVSKFYRFRYLEYGEAEGGFSRLISETAKPLRYGQPEGSVNELYLPPMLDWAAYALEKEKPLLITEGEKKAAAATHAGLPTIGLGGVWCWKSAREDMPMLPQFREFYWKDRLVYIVYDSDAVTNPKVVQAENALARELLMLGARPMICRLPTLEEGKKTGLDDYLVAKGSDAFMAEVLGTAEEFSMSEELFQLNEEVRYVREPGLVIRLDTLQRITARAFVEHAYADRTYHVTETTQNGSRSIEKSAPKEWLKWPGRSVVSRITYAPGEARITEHGELNCWNGWGTEPRKGDVKPWKELLDYLFREAEPSDRRWFEQWLAYPLQNPGAKLYSAVVLWGLIHGTGKSLIGYTMFRLYGPNGTEIGDRDLYSTHNEWAENKQFVMGDEITGGDKRSSADRMKSMITQRLLRLNPKYIPSYTVPDRINYYFTSNHPDAFFLEDTDRRFFIHEVRGTPKDSDFYRTYMKWLDNGGVEALFDYFLSMDLVGFDPQGHAPSTRSKMEMISNGRSDLGAWAAELRDNPDGILKLGDRVMPYALWSTSELFRLFDPDGRGKVTLNGLSRELRRAGFEKVCDGMPVATENGQLKLWAVRKGPSDEVKKIRSRAASYYDAERKKNGTGRGRKF